MFLVVVPKCEGLSFSLPVVVVIECHCVLREIVMGIILFLSQFIDNQLTEAG